MLDFPNNYVFHALFGVFVSRNLTGPVYSDSPMQPFRDVVDSPGIDIIPSTLRGTLKRLQPTAFKWVQMSLDKYRFHF